MGTTPCTIAPGKVSAEVAIVDWERNRDGGVRTDSLLIGDLSARVGITGAIEVLAAWTPYGSVWARPLGERAGRGTGSGDVTLGGKINLAHPDGSGLSVAVLPFVALPVGGKDFGSGDWGAGVVVASSYALNDTISLQLTPEFDLATDSDGRGRHPAYSLIAGIGVALGDDWSITNELATGRDHDPEGRTTQAFYANSIAWMPRDELQFDLGTVFGLNRRSPDVRFYVGIARHF
jgi:hypothetical protein